MSNKSRKMIVKAWRDPMFRSRMSHEDQASIPANPAGLSSLDEFELEQVVGGWTFTNGCTSLGCGSDDRCSCNIFCAKTDCKSDIDCQPGGGTVDIQCTTGGFQLY
jgi:mersacidin/lichenicidin family type 2 lantibiotic